MTTADYIRQRWRLVSVQSDTGTVEMPAGTSMGLTFQPTGEVTADDCVNFITAHYRSAGQGVSITAGRTTLVGYVGDDPAQLLAIAAIRRLTLGGEDRSSIHAGIATDGDALQITIDEYTLRLRRTTAD